jgi:hypothetical protein
MAGIHWLLLALASQSNDELLLRPGSFPRRESFLAFGHLLGGVLGKVAKEYVRQCKMGVRFRRISPVLQPFLHMQRFHFGQPLFKEGAGLRRFRGDLHTSLLWLPLRRWKEEACQSNQNNGPKEAHRSGTLLVDFGLKAGFFPHEIRNSLPFEMLGNPGESVKKEPGAGCLKGITR